MRLTHAAKNAILRISEFTAAVVVLRATLNSFSRKKALLKDSEVLLWLYGLESCGAISTVEIDLESVVNTGADILSGVSGVACARSGV
ncbi:hypothetical protein SLE2022_306950 [Rubroshorea leprosula]